MQWIYNYFLYPLLFLGFYLISFRNQKIRNGFQVRKNRGWLKTFSGTQQWVWFHFASGELEYAKPVIRELKKNPNIKIMATYFSPSVAQNLSKTPEIDLAVPTPWDTPKHWNSFLDHYQPAVLAIARTDTWPNMIWQTKKRNIPTILFSATLPSHSGRIASRWGRLLYGSVVSKISHISCVTDEDKINFLKLSEKPTISVDGDTRFDQVCHRLQEKRPIKTLFEGEKIFVAGSTWPEDEEVVLPALVSAVEKGLKVIIAPHEPSEKHLSGICRKLDDLKLSWTLYSQPKEEAPIIIVDQVGVLAELYKSASIAFVGGSFKKAVHSVMEPAACGALTIFGPYHYSNREALQLKQEGLALEIGNSGQLERILLEELEINTDSRKARILDFVAKRCGVSRQIAEWIKTRRQMKSSPSTPELEARY